MQPYFTSAPIGNTMFINTWYCSNKNNYNSFGMTFETLYYNFKPAARFLGIDLDKIHVLDLFPSIDFEYFEIANAKEWLNNNSRKRVFIANGHAHSGQSYNFPFAEVINSIAQTNPNIDFLITSNEPGIMSLSNVFMTSDIIKKNNGDLNENAFLASNSDIIIGRCSGPYSFAMTRETYWHNPKTFLAFTVLGMGEIAWTNKLTPPFNAKFLRYDFHDINLVINAINENIQNIV
jgi:hypothetical protein